MQVLAFLAIMETIVHGPLALLPYVILFALLAPTPMKECKEDKEVTKRTVYYI